MKPNQYVYSWIRNLSKIPGSESLWKAIWAYRGWEIEVQSIDAPIVNAKSFKMIVYDKDEDFPFIISNLQYIGKYFQDDSGWTKHLNAQETQIIIDWFIFGTPLGGKPRKIKRCLKKSYKVGYKK